MIIDFPLNVLENIIFSVENPRLPIEDDHPLANLISALTLHGGRRDLRFLYTAYVGSLPKEYYSTKTSKYLDHPFFEFIAKQNGLVVAGGFPTQLWLDQKPRNESDIDLYVLSMDAFYNLWKFMNIQHVEVPARSLDHTVEGKVYTSVFQVQIPHLEYTVQVLVFDGMYTPEDVIASFDLSHCKCFLYKGKVYATPEAEQSLIERRSFICKNKDQIRSCRARKALDRYVDSIINIADGWKECDCEPVEWKEVHKSVVRIEHGVCESYPAKINKNHSCANRFPYKLFEPGTTPRMSLLDRMAGMIPGFGFKLTYTKPTSYGLIRKNLLYTREKDVMVELTKEFEQNKGLVDYIESRIKRRNESTSNRLSMNFIENRKWFPLSYKKEWPFNHIICKNIKRKSFSEGKEYELMLTYTIDRIDFYVIYRVSEGKTINKNCDPPIKITYSGVMIDFEIR